MLDSSREETKTSKGTKEKQSNFNKKILLYVLPFFQTFVKN